MSESTKTVVEQLRVLDPVRDGEARRLSADERLMLARIVTQPLRRVERRRSDRSVMRRRVPLVLLGTAALAVSVALLLLTVPSGRPPARAGGWRLVGFNSAPFRDLGSGEGQPGLQCMTDDICYAPGFVPGSGGPGNLIYKTVDGGQQWAPLAPLPVGMSEAIQSFRCSSATVCFVSDSKAITLTSDGGESWTSIDLPAGSEEISPVWCLDALHCIVSESGTGSLLGIAVTSDGGAQWSTQTVSPVAGGVWDLTCDTTGRCLVLMLGPSTVSTLTSPTWGAPWTAQPAVSTAHFAILHHSCPDATHCMLVAPLDSSFEIITTTNAGLTWQIEGPPAGWLNMPTAVGCSNQSECWIAMSLYDASGPNGAYSSPLIEATTNFGASWTPLSLPTTSPAIADVLTLSCPPSGNGCLAIGNGKDHFVRPSGRPHPLSGPILLSNLPQP